MNTLTTARLAGGLASLCLLLGGTAAATEDAALDYTVRSGDTLIRLGRERLITASAWQEVARFNQLSQADSLRPGQTLRLPLRLLKHQAAPARLVSVAGEVRLAGQRAEVGAVVNEGAALQTGPDSAAVVELADGSRVRLSPRTQGEITTQRYYAMRDAGASGSSNWFSGLIRLGQGTLETLAAKGVRRATPLQIQTATSTVGVRGTQFRVSMDDPAGRNARSEVLEGLVRADNTAQGSAADLPQGTGAVIDPRRKDIQVTPLLAPPPLVADAGERFKPEAELAWGALAGAAAYRVQVASDAGFDHLVRELRVDAPHASLGGLPSGSWFVRVRGIDAQGLEGFDAVTRLGLRDAVAAVPVLRWQITHARLSLVHGETVLSWSAQLPSGQAVQASGYRLELARERGFHAVLREAASGQASMGLGVLDNGPYVLRLWALLADGRTLQSQVYQLRVPDNWGSSVLDAVAALQPLEPD